MNPTEPKFALGDVVQASVGHPAPHHVPRAVVLERNWDCWEGIYSGNKQWLWAYRLSGNEWWPEHCLYPIPDACEESWEEMRERLKADAGVVA